MSSTLSEDRTESLCLGDLFLASFTKLTSVQPGERVFDICARDGSAVLQAARRAGENGEVLALDRDLAALQDLARRARAEGITSLRTEAGDGRRFPSTDSYWDVVLCHMAFPQLPDPEAALKETLRVIRPVGRLGISTWGQKDRCPLLTIFLEAIAPFVPRAAEASRQLFRYSEAGALATTLADAGFEDATPERLTEWPTFRDVDDYWTTLATDLRLAELVAPMDADQVAAAKATIEAKTRFYRRRDGLEIKVEGIVLAAVK